MTTFFGILFIILGINAVLMFLSLGTTNQKAKKTSSNEISTSTTKIYPIDLITSKYKKVI